MSLQIDMHRQAEAEKSQDDMYQMLVQDSHAGRDELAHGIMNMIADYTQPPATQKVRKYITGEHAAVVQKVLLVAACAHEPNFLQHMLEQNAVCSSTLSEYAVQIIPALIQNYLDGKVNTRDFLAEAIHAYIIL